MKITKRQLRRIIKEEKRKIISEMNPDVVTEVRLNERGTGNPELLGLERAVRSSVAEFADKYMLTMGINPSDPADAQRVHRAIDDIINSVLGEGY